jgi:hypothetical protein
MTSRREIEREFDRIAASRMRLHSGGLEDHVALGESMSITWRFKLKKMGLSIGGKASELTELIDAVAIQRTLMAQSLGVRYATVTRKTKQESIWGKDSF